MAIVEKGSLIIRAAIWADPAHGGGRSGFEFYCNEHSSSSQGDSPLLCHCDSEPSQLQALFDFLACPAGMSSSLQAKLYADCREWLVTEAELKDKGLGSKRTK